MPELNLQLRDAETGEVLPQRELGEDEALGLMERAEIIAAELVPWGSNHTFAVAIEAEGEPGHLAIYKPIAGERPLHDFPFGTLHKRERASYLLSKALGWDIVPPTIIRDGPYGEGSMQIYVPSQPGFEEDEDFWGADTIENERMVLFDHLANNADRKITHCMVSEHGRIIGIDHGLTFNRYPKLRTVMWQFVEEPIRPELLADMDQLADTLEPLQRELERLLAPAEVAAFLVRLDELLEIQQYPMLDPNLNIPWGWW